MELILFGVNLLREFTLTVRLSGIHVTQLESLLE